MVSGYYRQPSVHRDTIAFVCEDDLWTVPLAGGVARRLTANPGRASFPCFSPDGKHLAFTGSDDGPTEAYVMAAGGGAPVRLSFTGSLVCTVGWSRDGKSVLFSSNAGQPFPHLMHLHEVAARGGPARRLAYGPAREIALEPRGKGVVLGINSGDPARWKRYRGGTAGTLWIDRKGTGGFAPLIRLDGNLAGPMWIGGRIYFLSDHEGCGNLYSCTPTGRGLRRHTHHDGFYVRFPSTDGRSIVYHAGADLFAFDVKRDKSRRVEVALHSPRAARGRRFVGASDYLEGCDLHPKGHSLACIARGGAFTFALWEGAPLRHGAISGTRVRLARWLPGGERLVAVHDEGGEEGLVVLRAKGGVARRVRGDFGRVLDLVAAPSGSLVALSNHRQEVIVVDLKAGGRKKKVETSRFDRIQGMAWSPDGRWLAYGFHVGHRTCCLHLFDSRSGKVSPITRPEFLDTRPAFDPDGKYLYFLSHRAFDPIYDDQYFDLSFVRGAQPCLIPLAATTPSPFVAATRPPRAPGDEDGDEKDKKKKKGKKPVVVDLKGITDRVVTFPMTAERYERILGASKRVFLSWRSPEGSLDEPPEGAEPPARTQLDIYDLEKLKTDTLDEAMTDFGLSQEAKTLWIRTGNHLRVLPASIEPKDVSDKEYLGRETGWIDLGRLRLEVEPGAEWRQMFREAWRLQRDQFWTPDMSKVDWPAVHDRYLPLVDRVGSRSEFSDLMWEMQGELGTSHCYELGGDYRPGPDWFQGYLGADLVWDARAKGWRIRRIPRGDSWEPTARSPLAAPGLGIKEGDTIVAVDGRAVDRRLSPFACLVNQPEAEVVLGVRAAGKRKDLTVKTLGSELALRYRDWVEANRARVHRETRGRVGYLHVPDMLARGYAEFHRHYRNEMNRPGLIVDVRFNQGGHVSPLLLEKLLRKRIGYDASRWQGAFPYPYEAPMGPMVALTNEYAGSDGDIFCHAFKLFGLGPLIGKRTWGGVIGIWPRHTLVDGTVTTQPEFGFWFRDVGWGLENYGTDPDIEVDILPQDHAAGRDPQLDRGLAEIGKILKETKPAVPKLDKRPNLKPPRLPKS